MTTFGQAELQTASTHDCQYAGLRADELITCPYDENHILQVKRMPYHLIKERNNFRGVKNMKECPFNALHHILEIEFNYHKMTCPDRFSIEESLLKEKKRRDCGEYVRPDVDDYNLPESTEDWEAEAQADVENLNHFDAWNGFHKPKQEQIDTFRYGPRPNILNGNVNPVILNSRRGAFRGASRGGSSRGITRGASSCKSNVEKLNEMFKALPSSLGESNKIGKRNSRDTLIPASLPQSRPCRSLDSTRTLTSVEDQSREDEVEDQDDPFDFVRARAIELSADEEEDFS